MVTYTYTDSRCVYALMYYSFISRWLGCTNWVQYTRSAFLVFPGFLLLLSLLTSKLVQVTFDAPRGSPWWLMACVGIPSRCDTWHDPPRMKVKDLCPFLWFHSQELQYRDVETQSCLFSSIVPVRALGEVDRLTRRAYLWLLLDAYDSISPSHISGMNDGSW